MAQFDHLGQIGSNDLMGLNWMGRVKLIIEMHLKIDLELIGGDSLG